MFSFASGNKLFAKLFTADRAKPSDHAEMLINDPRIYAQLDTLIRAEFQCQGFSLRPRQPAKSQLTGKHASKLRGRGLNFEELRHYRSGDDIRTMDWKVTNRTKKPHIRVYTEERERNVMLVVDQRISMFFGSQHYMKSALAAEVAALIAWRVSGVGDNIGALLFNDTQTYAIRPRRSRQHVVQLLSKLTEVNQSLKAGIQPSTDMLNQALKALAPTLSHDALVIMIGDGNGWDSQTSDAVRRIRQHNDVISIQITDPAEQELPSMDQLIVSDGHYQISVKSSGKQTQEQFDQDYQVQLGTMSRELKKYDIPMLSIDTLSPAYQQLARALGA